MVSAQTNRSRPPHSPRAGSTIRSQRLHRHQQSRDLRSNYRQSSKALRASVSAHRVVRGNEMFWRSAALSHTPWLRQQRAQRFGVRRPPPLSNEDWTHPYSGARMSTPASCLKPNKTVPHRSDRTISQTLRVSPAVPEGYLLDTYMAIGILAHLRMQWNAPTALTRLYRKPGPLGQAGIGRAFGA